MPACAGMTKKYKKDKKFNHQTRHNHDLHCAMTLSGKSPRGALRPNPP
jgi:hypothetical protein